MLRKYVRETSLCRVVDTEKDAKGLVRDVKVEMRPRSARDWGIPFKTVNLQKMKVGVNRLVLFFPMLDTPKQSKYFNNLFNIHALKGELFYQVKWLKLIMKTGSEMKVYYRGFTHTL